MARTKWQQDERIQSKIKWKAPTLGMTDAIKHNKRQSTGIIMFIDRSLHDNFWGT
jgi:hypothetical protein